MHILDEFNRCVDRIFGSYFSNLGMFITESKPTSVIFSNQYCFIEILVLLNDGPLYSPRVEIGPLPELGNLSRDKQVDILHTIPLLSPLREYNLQWRYSKVVEMESVFLRIRDEIFDVYARRFLDDHDLLIKLVRSRSEENDKQWREEILNHNETVHRQNASIAFSQKNYVEFVREISQIADGRRSLTDSKKLVYALRQINQISM